MKVQSFLNYEGQNSEIVATYILKELGYKIIHSKGLEMRKIETKRSYIPWSKNKLVADYERENPYFKEAVKLAITPMISSLSLMENAESESEVLGIGISVIVLNLGMYLGVPAIVIVGIRKKF